MGSRTEWRRDGTWNRVNFTAFFSGESCRNERAAFFSSFYHHGADGQTRDDPVSPWKIGGQGSRVERKLTDQRSLFCNSIKQPFVLRRITDGETAPQHSPSAPSFFNCFLMNTTINASGQPTHRGHTGLRQSRRN